jgi:N-acetylneuraminic acid mutarotase
MLRHIVQQLSAHARTPHLKGFLVQQKGSTDILLFGGEYYDGKTDKMRVYNDIHVYHPDKNTWTRIISPNGYAKVHCI